MKKLEDELVAPDAMHATHDQIERMVVTEGQDGQAATDAWRPFPFTAEACSTPR